MNIMYVSAVSNQASLNLTNLYYITALFMKHKKKNHLMTCHKKKRKKKTPKNIYECSPFDFHSMIVGLFPRC